MINEEFDFEGCIDTCKETVIGHLTEEKYISIDTDERKYMNRLLKYKEEYPNDVKIISQEDNHIFAKLSKDKFNFPFPVPKREMSEENKEKARIRLQKYHNNKD